MTSIYNKEGFLKALANSIEDDQIILVSQDIDGDVTFLQKRKIKRVPFAFSAEAFKKDQGIGDIGFGEVLTMGICILEPKQASDNIRKLLTNFKP